MFVLFITKEKNVCSLIASRLTQKNIQSKVMDDNIDAFDFIKNTKDVKIDLLAVDYRSCIHENFSFFNMLKENEIFIPCFFYNHPLTTEENYIDFWADVFDEYFKDMFASEVIEDAENIISYFKEILFSQEVNPYVSIINRPKILYDMSSSQDSAFLSAGEFEEDFSYSDLECLRNNFYLPPSRFKLLKYLFDHKNYPCKIEELCNFMWHKCDSTKIQTLYSYIYDLKNAIKKSQKKSIELERFAKEEYILLTGKYTHEAKQNFFINR